MKKQTSLIATIIGSILLISAMSCEKEALTRSTETDNHIAMPEDSLNVEDKSGIILKLESDTLEEQIEVLHFHPQEWQEEEMSVNYWALSQTQFSSEGSIQPWGLQYSSGLREFA